MKFQITTKTLETPKPEEIAEALLIEAGTSLALPTDEHKIINFLGLQQLSFDFMHELDFIPKTSNIEIRAALSLNDRLIATQAGLSRKRKRWGMFHEIAHFILPEHRDKLFLDDDANLSWWVKSRIEREANEMAAELLFQGSRFTEEALSKPTSARTAIDLAPKFGASFESALRRYTERHVLPCAVIVYDKIPKAGEDIEPDDVEYKVHYTVTSKPFKKSFFAGIEIKGGTVKGSELLKRDGWWSVGDVIECELTIGRGAKENPWHFQTEVFTNGYKVFQFILPPNDCWQV